MIAGTLTCKGQGSVGLIVGSKQALTCVYVRAGNGATQNYTATITKIGLDIGFKAGSVMIWTVLGSGPSLAPGSLLGNYGGVSAEATVALGAGANALIGGNKNSVVLQPLPSSINGCYPSARSLLWRHYSREVKCESVGKETIAIWHRRFPLLVPGRCQRHRNAGPLLSR